MKWFRQEWKFVGALVVILFVFSEARGNQDKQIVNSLKNEINQVVQTECLSNQSAAVLSKYNDLVQALVDQQMTAYRLNLRKGDLAKAAADLAFAKRYRADEIPIPSKKQLQTECSKPLLA